MNNSVTLDMIRDAQTMIKSVARITDLVPSKYLSIPGKRRIFLKTECLQHTGSFKLRGAYNRIARLSPEIKKTGVIASSAGNHAQGVALAANRLGIPATIVMPQGSPLSKIAATKHYGAEVILAGKIYHESHHAALSLQKESGAMFIHPYDDPFVIAGQGTIGLEIIQANPNIDTVVVPIGGGGLASGIAIAVKETNPKIRVIGVEAEGAASMKKAFQQNKIRPLSDIQTLADGIAVSAPSQRTFEICRKYLDDIVTVSDDEICTAILTLLEKRKLIAEGAGAASLAAMLFEKFNTTGNIACVISGGNIDVTMLQKIINRGLVFSGRMATIRTAVKDSSDQLSMLLELLSGHGVNIQSIRCDRNNMFLSIGSVEIELLLETRDSDHIREIYQILESNGYPILN